MDLTPLDSLCPHNELLEIDFLLVLHWYPLPISFLPNHLRKLTLSPSKRQQHKMDTPFGIMTSTSHPVSPKIHLSMSMDGWNP